MIDVPHVFPSRKNDGSGIQGLPEVSRWETDGRIFCMSKPIEQESDSIELLLEHENQVQKEMDEEEEERQRSSHGGTFDMSLYKREYEEVEKSVKDAFPQLSGRDFRLEVKHQFKSRFYDPDMESMRNEKEKREYDSTKFEVLENGDIYYPQSGRTMMELYERTRKYRPELFSQKEYDIALLVARAIKQGAKEVSFPSYFTDGNGRETIRDVYTMVIDGNQGHIVTRNVAGDGPHYTLTGIQDVMRTMFAGAAETSPKEGVYVFTDRKLEPLTEQPEPTGNERQYIYETDVREVQQARERFAAELPHTIGIKQPAAEQLTNHAQSRVPEIRPVDRNPMVKKEFSFHKQLQVTIDRAIRISSLPLFLRWATERIPHGEKQNTVMTNRKEKGKEKQYQAAAPEQSPPVLQAKETKRNRRRRIFTDIFRVRERNMRPQLLRRKQKETVPPHPLPATKEHRTGKRIHRERLIHDRREHKRFGMRQLEVKRNIRTGTEQHPRNNGKPELKGAQRKTEGRMMTKKQERRIKKILETVRIWLQETPMQREIHPKQRQKESAVTVKKEEIVSAAHDRKETLMKRATAGIFLSLFLYYMLEQETPLPSGGTPEETHDGKERQKERAAEPHVSPWIMLSIIWHLNMLRESGFAQGNKKTTAKKKRNRRRKRERFPSSGVVFSYAVLERQSVGNVL